ncbi:MAG: serine/threonine protein kinase [Hyalangium sp.]|uniref:serine/threonine protein kinase n=1 Tax=Hyalangium sp. TaxID=2028555 RepID=UPI003899B530
MGAGSFGAVYQVEWEGELFALKFSLRHPESSDDLNQTAARLQKELACLVQIQHPNIVRTYAYGRWPHPIKGYPYVLMDYVDGLTLHDWRQRVAPTFRQVLEVFGKLALALDALDGVQLRHRDVKGSNILVRSRDGEPVLIDFGSAHHAQGVRLTDGPLPPGTPHYRTPESLRFQRQHYHKPNARYLFQLTDDLYSLGVALYEMLAGRAPFSPDLPREVLNMEIERRVPLSPVKFDERLSSAMCQLALRMLEKKPGDRPQTGHAVHEQVQALLRAEGALLDEKVLGPPLELLIPEQDSEEI